MDYKTESLEETYELAREFVEGRLCHLGAKCSNKGSGATVVGLYGDLGAGKTSFTQGVAKAFGLKDNVTSPTFVLEKIYRLNKGFLYKHLVHIDCYRLNNKEEISALGWSEVVKDSKNVILMEWPERIEGILPKDIIKIYFEIGERENERKIKILC